MHRPDGNDRRDPLTDRISDCLGRLDALLADVANAGANTGATQGAEALAAALALADGTDELRQLVDALLRSSGGRGVPIDPRHP